MHDLPLLVNIAMALALAFLGGLLARRVGLPTIAGYLLAGIAIGPFTPGFVGDVGTIRQLAELGVIFLMFGVGLHFSFRDLWRVRDIAVPGAIGQTLLVAGLGAGLGQLWGWPLSTSIIVGLALSVASTVVLLRSLMDTSLLNTTAGQAAVGWLVMEDLLTVAILIILPALAPAQGGFSFAGLGLTLLKATAFIGLVAFVGRWLIPWLLLRIAHTRSHELFILATLAIALGTAIGAAELFGASLALGAFVAGAVVSESPLSHQVGADVLPFREAFSVLFFVSVGMLVNPAFLVHNIGPVLAITAMIMIAKPLIVLLMGFFFSHSAFTMLVIAAGRSQIGEFSFILGQAGLSLGLLQQEHYSLLLAGALLSITLNPMMFRLIGPVTQLLQRFPRLWRLLDRHGPAPALPAEGASNHLVIVGFGRVGEQVVAVARALNLPHLVIESDVERVDRLNEMGTATLYGDAANSEVLTHAGLSRARALVSTVPEDATGEMIVAATRDLAPHLPIIVRTSTEAGVRTLADLGAHDIAINSDEEHRLLHSLLDAANNIEICWERLDAGSPLIGRSLAEANVRAISGASVVALIRDRQLFANPKSSTVFHVGDRIGLVGDPQQIAAATAMIGPVRAPDSAAADGKRGPLR